jgi:hypothetical protein
LIIIDLVTVMKGSLVVVAVAEKFEDEQLTL